MPNLLGAWREFVRGKKKRPDVMVFQICLADNILKLHLTLREKIYLHDQYHAFNISDPKPRVIHKATVRDRVLHRAIYRILYPFFDKIFISDSYSCRIRKGTHRAIQRFRYFYLQASMGNTKTVWVLKCDIRKFFANIDHVFLLQILGKYIQDEDILRLLGKVVASFSSTVPGVGLPLGNLTSQLFVNIYMNEFDQFVKHKLKAKLYTRYADDFIIMSPDKNWLDSLLPRIKEVLKENLRLELHPDKISMRTISSGNDFLGWVHFPHHRVLRTTTKNRMFKKIRDSGSKPEVIQSYLGLLSHGNAYGLKKKVLADL